MLLSPQATTAVERPASGVWGSCQRRWLVQRPTHREQERQASDHAGYPKQTEQSAIFSNSYRIPIFVKTMPSENLERFASNRHYQKHKEPNKNKYLTY
ncbi:MAG: hypothetical protein IPL99_08385 [Candidatus Competibacteraceae bacterium]|nr:hypothetical protein [Candidatus Competibacteraceae bacterium]